MKYILPHEFRKFERRLRKFFRIHPKIIFTTAVKAADSDYKNKEIRINPNLRRRKMKETLIHEFIHLAWNIDHDDLARHCSYWSYAEKEDHFSKLIMKVIRRRREFKKQRKRKKHRLR